MGLFGQVTQLLVIFMLQQEILALNANIEMNTIAYCKKQ
jgi:hypothetical protein